MKHTCWPLTLMLGLVATSAVAEIRMTQEVNEIERYVDENGVSQMRLIDAASIVPGDEIRYRIRVENTGKETAEDIVIDNPVPPDTTYMEGSAFGHDTEITYSVDGGVSYAPLVSLTVTSQSGEERRATAADVTNIRWTLRSLPAGSEAFVSFRVTVK